MSALSPAVAGILHRLTDPTTELLDQAQSLADELAAGLVGVELVDEKGERTFVEGAADELCDVIAELVRLHAGGAG